MKNNKGEELKLDYIYIGKLKDCHTTETREISRKIRDLKKKKKRLRDLINKADVHIAFYRREIERRGVDYDKILKRRLKTKVRRQIKNSKLLAKGWN